MGVQGAETLPKDGLDTWHAESRRGQGGGQTSPILKSLRAENQRQMSYEVSALGLGGVGGSL